MTGNRWYRRAMRIAMVVAVVGIGISVYSGLRQPAATILYGGRYDFSAVSALAADGPDIWVANNGNSSLTELNASTGAWVRTLSGSRLGLDYPTQIAAYGNYLWVVNQSEQPNAAWTLIQLNAATGTRLRTLKWDGTASLGGIALDGGELWVTGDGFGHVTELNASTGAVIRVVSSLDFDFDTPDTIAADGPDIWVANQNGNSGKDSVTELDAATGKILRTIPYDALPDPGFIYADGAHIWVASSNDGDSSGPAVCGSVTELDADTGAVLRVLEGGRYGFDDPLAIVANGTNVWVANWRSPVYACPGGGPSGLTEFSAANGAWEQTATGNCSVLENTVASLLDGPPGCFVPSGMVAADGHIWFGSNDSVIGIKDRLPAARVSASGALAWFTSRPPASGSTPRPATISLALPARTGFSSVSSGSIAISRPTGQARTCAAASRRLRSRRSGRGRGADTQAGCSQADVPAERRLCAGLHRSGRAPVLPG